MIATPTDPAPPKASPFVTFHALRYVRRSGFLEPGEDVTCLLGHHIRGRKVYPLEDGSLPCPHRDGYGRPECGAQVYVLVFPGRGSERRLWAADVEHDDMRLFERGGFSVRQILTYFNARFPNGPARIIPPQAARV